MTVTNMCSNAIYPWVSARIWHKKVEGDHDGARLRGALGVPKA